jgi:outer membrane protein assembly factor BamB
MNHGIMPPLKKKGEKWQRWITAGIIIGLLLLTGTYIINTFTARAVSPNFANSGTWTTYMGGLGRSGYNMAETVINRTSAPTLKLHWSVKAGGSISAEPVVANNMIYWGSWDGYEHGTNLDGTLVWQMYLGAVKELAGCHPPSAGIASTATIATVKIGGVNTSVLFVGGGNAIFYALNAMTGAIIWQTTLGVLPAYYLWGSPLYYKGSVYIGSASFGDCPLTPGQLIKMNATTGAIENTFTAAPPGCVGGGIWSSPTVDTSTGEIYVTTGTYQNSCPVLEPYPVSIVELHSSDLSVAGSWQIPVADRAPDGDFGASPTLFQALVNGHTQYMVGAGNKNGKFYAFIRGALNNGPIWTDTFGISGNCPQCGQGIIGTSAWNNTKVLVAGGTTTINGTSCAGFLRALNPATGTVSWENCLPDGPVLGGVIAVPGLAIVGEGNAIQLIDSSTGQTLNSLVDSLGNSRYFSVGAISNGVLYMGNMDGYLYAYGI